MFEKPWSVYTIVVLCFVLIGTAVYANRQQARNDFLVERLNYYKAQIKSLESSIAVRKDAFIESEIVIQKTQETANRLAEKGDKLAENAKALSLEGDKKENDQLNKRNSDSVDDKLNNRMWSTYCQTNPSDKACRK